MNELLLFSVTSPIKAGIYHQKALIRSYEREGKVGEELYALLEEILASYKLDALYYLQGPGSFTAIKLSYIFLKTLSIAHAIPLFGADSFTFNKGAPIHAYGDSYFVKESGKITLHRTSTPPERIPYELPALLDSKLFISNPTPLYILPAVQWMAW